MFQVSGRGGVGGRWWAVAIFERPETMADVPCSNCSAVKGSACALCILRAERRRPLQTYIINLFFASAAEMQNAGIRGARALVGLV